MDPFGGYTRGRVADIGHDEEENRRKGRMRR
jgi:hypothetical protein